MQQIINEFRSVRKFLYILVAMGLINHPTGPDELAAFCGISPKTASAGLKHLEFSGHVHRVKGQNGWLMTSAGQLFLTPNPENLRVSPTTTIIKLTNKSNIKELKAVETPNRYKLRVYSPEIHYPKYLALKAAHIGEPSRSTLARMDITIEYVEAHIKQFKSDQKDDPRLRIGILVNRIKNNDAMPVIEDFSEFYQ